MTSTVNASNATAMQTFDVANLPLLQNVELRYQSLQAGIFNSHLDFSVSKSISNYLARINNAQKVINGIFTSSSKVFVKKTISTQIMGDGVMYTRITNPLGVNICPPTIKRYDCILNTLKLGATYDRLHVTAGAHDCKVLHTPDGITGLTSTQLLAAHKVRDTKVFMNGGYFANLPDMLLIQPNLAPGKDPNTDSSAVPTNGKRGYKIGPAGSCKNAVPIPPPWQADYGYLKQGEHILLACGPRLTKNDNIDFSHVRFQYYDENGWKNLLSYFQGHLTHASTANPRTAIAIEENGDIALHAVSTANRGYQRAAGVNMNEWREMVQAMSPTDNTQILNLDGAGSISMGVIKNGVITQIAKGDEQLRSLANILVVGSGNKTATPVSIAPAEITSPPTARTDNAQ